MSIAPKVDCPIAPSSVTGSKTLLAGSRRFYSNEQQLPQNPEKYPSRQFQFSARQECEASENAQKSIEIAQ
jgi:hypothetical protein